MSARQPSVTVVSQTGEGLRTRSRARGRRRLTDLLPVALAAIVFVAVWQLVVWVGDYPTFILPGPVVVGERFVRAWLEGTMTTHFLATLAEVALGLLVGAVSGLVIGIVLARSRLAARLLSPYLVAAQATPILALAPLIALWFGTGFASKVLICALICFFPMAVVDARRGPLGRCRDCSSSRGRSERPAGRRSSRIEVPAALPRSRRPPGRASRSRWWARSWPSGRAATAGLACSSTSHVAASSTSR